MNTPEKKEVGTLRDVRYVARRFEVTEVTVRRWIKDGDIQAHRMPDAKPGGKSSYWFTDHDIKERMKGLYGARSE